MRATDPAVRAVLLVDDEGCIRASVSRVLERAGYVVTLAASGAEALERVRAERYAVVICDLRMPGLSGIALFDQLQQAAPGLAGRPSGHQYPHPLLTPVARESITRSSIRRSIGWSAPGRATREVRRRPPV